MVDLSMMWSPDDGNAALEENHASITNSRSEDSGRHHALREIKEPSSALQIPGVSDGLNSTSALSSQPGKELRYDSDEGDSATTKTSQRSASPNSTLLRCKDAQYEKVGDGSFPKMHKFSLYETASRFYIVGADVMDRKFRILKIDRTSDVGALNVAEDDIVYTKKETNHVLNAVDDGNKSSGGLKLRSSNWGLLGFIRFTGDYYMLLITKRSQVAVLGGHYIYQIDGTELVSLGTTSSTRSKSDRHPDEARFVSILSNLDLSRSFYFSYSYDITHTLQHNICRERETLSQDASNHPKTSFNDMFIWNHHLLEPATQVLKTTYEWCIPVMHGFVDQASEKSLPMAFIAC